MRYDKRTYMQQQSWRHVFSEYFKEVIYGGIDGIVTTFAVVAGFAGAALSTDTTTQLSFVVVLLFGLANLFADAASMGLGNFLSVRSEKDLFLSKRAKLQETLRNQPDVVLTDARGVMIREGFSETEAEELLRVYRANESYLLDFLMQKGEGMSDPRGENEMFTGLATFVSFMIFGAVPLLPFMLQTEGDAATAFFYSVIGTFLALVLLGVLKWRVVGGRLHSALVEVVLVGGTAAVLAYIVGTFFAT